MTANSIGYTVVVTNVLPIGATEARDAVHQVLDDLLRRAEDTCAAVAWETLTIAAHQTDEGSVWMRAEVEAEPRRGLSTVTQDGAH